MNSKISNKSVPLGKYSPPSEEEIACCAFTIIARENPQLASSKWWEAEAQLTAMRRHEAGILKRTDDPTGKTFARQNRRLQW